MASDEMRIGDHERDEAVELLQEHMSAGRLTSEEFGERMSKALEARTWSDLGVLFTDLPGRRPGQPEQPAMPFASPSAWGAVTPAPTYGTPPPPPAVQHHDAGRPWYTQWWILIVAVMVTGMSGGRMGFLIPAVAIWIFVIAPALDKERQRRQHAAAGPPRPLTFYEREELLDEIRSGRPITAVKRYRELTGADLYTAKMTVDALRREIGR
ncbi:DUF1707 SHOCT-like domain-containing protein [Tessaracoccus sp. Z1128]